MNRLKELRLASEMKQEDLASRLSVKRQTVSRYENGLLDLDTATIARICSIFNCTSDFLLGLSTQRTAQISDADAALAAAAEQVTALTVSIDALKKQMEAQRAKLRHESKSAAAAEIAGFEQELEYLESGRAKAIYEGFSRRKAAEELCRKCGYARRFG